MEKHAYRGNEGKCIYCGNWEYDYGMHYSKYDIKENVVKQASRVDLLASGRKVECMKKGSKIVVHKIHFPTIDKEKIDEFKILTITKIRNDVPSMWGGDTKYTGYKAKDKEGHIYSQHWYSYPSDAMCPTKEWMPEAKDDCIWYDVEQVTLTEKLTAKPKWLKGELVEIIHWCSKHNDLYYDKCFKCEIEEKYPETKEKYKKQRSIAEGW